MHQPCQFPYHTSQPVDQPYLPSFSLQLTKIFEFPKPTNSSHRSTTNISSRLAGFLQHCENIFGRDLRFNKHLLCFDADIELDNTLLLGKDSGDGAWATPARHFNGVLVLLHLAIRGNTKWCTWKFNKQWSISVKMWMCYHFSTVILISMIFVVKPRCH